MVASHARRAVAGGRRHRRLVHAPPGHRARGRGGLLRGAVGAAADLRDGGCDRLRLRPVHGRADRRRAPGGARPGLARPHRPGGRQDHHADDRRRAGGRPPRRDLGRLRAGPLVGLAGDARVRRHHHDHARARRAPRDHQDPRPVVRAVPARHADGRRVHPADRRGAVAGAGVAARPARLPDGLLLARGAGAEHLLPGDALPRVGPGPDELDVQPARGDVLAGLLDPGLVRPALVPHRDRGGLTVDLRAARRPDRGAAVAVPRRDRRADRRGGQRVVRLGLPPEGDHVRPPRAGPAAAPADGPGGGGGSRRVGGANGGPRG